MRNGAALLAAALIAGCVPAGQSYRNSAAPIASTTRADAARLAGDWQVSEGLGPLPAAATFEVADGRVTALRLAEPAGLRRLPLAQKLPGRWVSREGEIWLFWVDDDYRTAALGAPDGRFVWILHREGQAGEDRAAAARAILRFYGFDTSRLAKAGS